MTQTTSLTSVHDAVIRASDVTRQPPLAPYQLKVNPRHKELAETILARNGTTLAEFLRQCMAGLVHDYAYVDIDKLAEQPSDTPEPQAQAE